jgi:S1-C subfamily serine protease
VTRAAAAFAALAVAAVAALVLLDDSAPSRSPSAGSATPTTPRSAPATPLRPVRVTCGGQIATGFAAGGDRIVTVAHVLGCRPEVGGRPAHVVRTDRRSDLALLAAPAGSTTASKEAPARAGARLRVLVLRNGRASSVSVRVRRPIVAHVRTAGAARAVTRPALELAAHVRPGDSGAPVVTTSGAVAGVIFASSRGREGTAYAVDASALRRLLRR